MHIQEIRIKSEPPVNQHFCYLILKEKVSRHILNDEIEKMCFLNVLLGIRKTCRAEIYAYCILDKEAHILISTEEKGGAEAVLCQLEEQFRHYYSEKYPKRKILLCHEKQDLENPTWEKVMQICAAIHALPVEDLRVAKAEDYWWSSLKEYLHRYQSELIHTEILLKLLNDNDRKAVQRMRAIQRAQSTAGAALEKNKKRT